MSELFDVNLSKPPELCYYILSQGVTSNLINVLDSELSEFPKEIGGQPCTYLWKDVIRDGLFLVHNQKRTLNITASRREKFLDNFLKMSETGTRIYVPVNHSDKAEDNRGYVVKMKNEGDRLYCLLQLIGEDAAKDAARNDVSVKIIGKGYDSKGNEFEDYIEHVALTSIPVITGLNSAAIAASQYIRSETKMPLTITVPDDQVELFKKLLPNGEKLSEETSLSLLTDHLKEIAEEDDADAGEPAEIVSLSRTDIRKKAKDKRSVYRKLPAMNAKLEEEKTTLSRLIPKKLDGDSKDALITALSIKKDVCISRGALSKPVADALYSRVVVDSKGNANDYALSSASKSNDKGSVLALELFTLLADNKPVTLGEGSGLQRIAKDMEESDEVKLSRKKADDEKKKEELRKEMLAANGSV